MAPAPDADQAPSAAAPGTAGAPEEEEETPTAPTTTTIEEEEEQEEEQVDEDTLKAYAELKEWADSDDPSVALASLSEQMQAAREGRMGAACATALLCDTLPDVCKALVRSSFGSLVAADGRPVRDAVLAFVEDALGTLTVFADPGRAPVAVPGAPLALCLTLLLDPQNQLYADHDESDLALDDDDVDGHNAYCASRAAHDGEFASLPSDEYGHVVPEFVALLDGFAAGGGLAALVRLVRRGDGTPYGVDVACLQQTARALVRCKSFLAPACVDAMASLLYAETARRLLGMDAASLKLLNHASLDGVLRVLRGFSCATSGHSRWKRRRSARLRGERAVLKARARLARARREWQDLVAGGATDAAEEDAAGADDDELHDAAAAVTEAELEVDDEVAALATVVREAAEAERETVERVPTAEVVSGASIPGDKAPDEAADGDDDDDDEGANNRRPVALPSWNYVAEFEKLSLDLALRYVCDSGALPKQVHGLNAVRAALHTASRKDEEEAQRDADGVLPPLPPSPAGQSSLLGEDKRHRTQWLSSAYVLPWLRRGRVAERLLEADRHSEIIKRSDDVLRYLAWRGCVDRPLVDLLWSHTVDQHGTVVATVYETLTALVTSLPPGMVDHAFSLVAAVPPARYGLREVRLVLSLAMHMLQRSRNVAAAGGEPLSADVAPCLLRHDFGLLLLWRAAQDDAGVPEDVRRQAVQHLQVLLNPPLGDAFRDRYVNLAVENLKAGRSMELSLRLIRAAVDSFREAEGRAQALAWLGSTHDLVALLLRSLAPDAGGRGAALQSRLDFLRFALAGSPVLALGVDGADRLWQNAVAGAAGPADRDAALRWVAAACPAAAVAADGEGTAATAAAAALFSPEVAEHLFERHVGRMARGTCTLAALECFRRYFDFCNVEEGALASAGAGSYRLGGGGGDDLRGVAFVWGVALEAESDDVWRSAGRMLVTLYSAPSAGGADRGGRAAFVRQCMDHLERGRAVPAVALRCLDLLHEFLDSSEEGGAGAAASAPSAAAAAATTAAGVVTANGGTLPRELHTVTVVGENRRVQVSIAPDAVVGHMVQALARHLNAPVLAVKLVVSGSPVGVFTAQLRSAGVVPGARVGVLLKRDAKSREMIRRHREAKAAAAAVHGEDDEKKRREAAPAEEDDDTDDDTDDDKTTATASWILSQTPSYFGLLFGLLSVPELTGRVWGLIGRLPVNATLAGCVRDLSSGGLAELWGGGTPEADGSDTDTDSGGDADTMDWQRVLDASSVFRLLYGLQIVDHHLFSPRAEARRHAWAARFVSTGGLAHVCGALLDFRGHETADCGEHLSAGRRCLFYVLKVVVSLSFEAARRGRTVLFDLDPPLEARVPTVHVRGVEARLAAALPPAPALVGRLLGLMTTVAASPLPAGSGRAESSPPQSGSPPTPPPPPPPASPPSPGFIGPTLPGQVPPAPAVAASAGSAVSASEAAAIRAAMAGSGSPAGGGGGEQQPAAAAGYSPPATVDADIVRLGFVLLGATVVRDEAVVPVVCPSGEHSAAFCRLATESLLSSDPATRVEALGGLLRLGAKAKADGYSVGHTLLVHLLRRSADVADAARSARAAEYFELVSSMLRTAYGPTTEADAIVQLFCRTFAQLTAYESAELTGGSPPDQVLVGLLGVLRTVAAMLPLRRAEVGAVALPALCDRFLFGRPSLEESRAAHAAGGGGGGAQNPPLCRSAASRRAAFALVYELCRGCEQSWQYVTRHLLRVYEDYAPPDTWSYVPSLVDRAEAGFAGMRNLGCTCYLNSSLQQLFLVPQLREALLSLELARAAGDGGEEEPDWLGELQDAFAHLALSERRAYDPTGFCLAYKDWDGQPVDVTEQMDANEFLNVLFDRVDERLKPTPHGAILRDSFGGRLANVVVCEECGFVSEREEPFYTLSVTTQGKPTLEEGLAAYVEGEKLSGNNQYSCSQCRKKVNAEKRACVKRLPATLFVHLKRFEFDYDIMVKRKLNDEVLFPPRLDMAPYTVGGIYGAGGPGRADDGGDDEGEEEEEEKVAGADGAEWYELTGVIVHTGVADAGHYYSFARERTDGGGRGCWFEFNDSAVSPFSPARIPAECFGGTEQRTVWDAVSGRRVLRTVPKTANAYMLLYERSDAPGPPAAAGGKTTLAERRARLAAEYAAEAARLRDSAEARARRALMLRRAAVPDDIFERVWRENRVVATHRMLLDPLYAEFVSNFADALPLQLSPVYPHHTHAWAAHLGSFSPVARVTLSFHFVFDNLAHAQGGAARLDEWERRLCEGLRASVPACVHLLRLLSAEESPWLRRFLLASESAPARAAFVRVVLAACGRLAEYERPLYHRTPMLSRAEGAAEAAAAALAAERGQQPQDDYFAGQRSAVAGLVDAVLLLLPAGSPYWRTFGDLFELLLGVARMGPQETALLVSRHAAGELGAFYLGRPYRYLAPRVRGGRGVYERMGNKTGVARLSAMLELLELLVRSSDVSRCAARVASLELAAGATEWSGDASADAAASLSRPGLPRAPPPRPPSSPGLPPPTRLPMGGDLPQLPDDDAEVVFGGALVGQLLRGAYNASAVAGVLAHASWECVPFTQRAAAAVAAAVDDMNLAAYPPIFCALTRLLDLEDSLQDYRVSLTLRLVLEAVQHNAEYADETNACISFVRRAAARNLAVAKWMADPVNRPYWAWIEFYVGGGEEG